MGFLVFQKKILQNFYLFRFYVVLYIAFLKEAKIHIANHDSI